MAGGSFNSILKLAVFVMTVWTAGKGAKMVQISPILPEIFAGLFLGPEMANLLPEQYTLCHAKPLIDKCSTDDMASHYENPKNPGNPQTLKPWNERFAWTDPMYWVPDFRGTHSETMHKKVFDKYSEKCINGNWENNKGNNEFDCMSIFCKKFYDDECAAYPNIFTLMGHFGVALMIFESGMHFHFPLLPVVGPKASIIAVVGTLGPIGMGIAMVQLLKSVDNDDWGVYPDSLAVGVALAPTSVGIALTLLMDSKQLDENFGQTIIAAAFLDDILSLIAFSMLFKVDAEGGKLTFGAFEPLVYGTIFLVIGGYLAAFEFPKRMEAFFDWVKDTNFSTKNSGKWPFKDMIHLTVMVILLVVYGWLTSVFGSHLWGCFVAGMSFSGVHGSIAIWSRQTKRLTKWMMRIFFSATVAFAIPVDDLLSFPALWKGLLLGLFAALLPKLVCALWIGETKYVIGWAMVGRAEFAYLIAEMAKTARMIDTKLFAILIWALLTATITAPPGFTYTLQKQIARDRERKEAQLKKQSDDIASPTNSKDPVSPPSGHGEDADQVLPLPDKRPSSPGMVGELKKNYNATRASVVSIMEIFDKTGEGTPMNAEALLSSLQIRIIFRNKPRTIESLFTNLPYQIQRLKALRHEHNVVMVFAIRSQEELKYNSLREARSVIFDKLNGGPAMNNIREINFLPPENSQLASGMIKLSIICDRKHGLLAKVIEAIHQLNYYVMQLNFTAGTTTSSCNLVAYPLPFEHSEKATEDNVDEEGVRKDIHLMDNIICSENVEQRLTTEMRPLKQKVISVLRQMQVSHNVFVELMLFQPDPLQNASHPPLAGRDENLNKYALLYVEIAYPKLGTEDKAKFSIKAAMDQQKGPEPVEPGDEPEAPTSFEGFPQTGCGLMIGDAFKWAQGLPKMLMGFSNMGYSVVHMRLDHMILIDRPLFICILDTSKRQFIPSVSPVSPPSDTRDQSEERSKDMPIPRQSSKDSREIGAQKIGEINIDMEEEFDVSAEKIKNTEAMIKTHIDETRFDITVMPLMPQASAVGSRSLHDQMGNPTKVSSLTTQRIATTRIAMDMRRTFGDLARSDRSLSKSRISFRGVPSNAPPHTASKETYTKF